VVARLAIAQFQIRKAPGDRLARGLLFSPKL
jgi:hypothetical protein